MHVGARQLQREGDAFRIGENVALRSRLAPIGRVRARRRAPLLAAIDALSRAARLKSIPFWRPSRLRSACCRRFHTPTLCQSRKRRQQVIPEPQPISRGSSSHGVPERSTNRIPVSAARSDVRGRPPFGLARSGGSNGAISAQRPSERSGLAISSQRTKPGFVRGFKYILSRRAVASPPWMCCTRSSWGQSSPLDDAASNELRWTGGITGPAQKR